MGQHMRFWNFSHFVNDVSSKYEFRHSVKPVLSGHIKIGKANILNTDGSLMQVDCIGAFCNTVDLHKAIIGIENQSLVFF